MEQFYDKDNNPYLPNVGGKVLNMLNSGKHALKDMEPDFADFFNLDLETIQSVVDGEIAPTKELVAIFEKHPALRVRDLYPEEHRNKFPINDRTKEGIVVFKKEDREKSARKSFRGPEGEKVHFYTYADTAMDESSLLKPEWIQEHFINDGEDPNSIPDWAFNKGHFEHQITYFIGPVNFHWKDKDGNKYVEKMNTGDTNYVTPFVPHTFTTREDPDKEPGIILAVTYGGTTATDKYQSKIQKETLAKYVKSRSSLNKAEELPTDKLKGVMTRKYKDAKEVSSEVFELMWDIPYQKNNKATEIRLEDSVLDLETKADRWGFNTGDSILKLGEYNIEPGDSFLIKRNTKHTFSGKGKLLLIDSLPEDGDTKKEETLIKEYSGDISRIHTENTRWF